LRHTDAQGEYGERCTKQAELENWRFEKLNHFIDLEG